MTHKLLRSFTLALSATAILAASAQENKVRIKVKADLDAPPDREVGMAKAVYGDAGSFVALKTLGGKTALGGLTEQEIGWELFVIGSDKLNVIKRDKPKFVWGIGPVALETIETFNKQFRVILSKPDPDHGKLMLMQQELGPRSLTGRAPSLIMGVPYDIIGRSPSYFKPGMTVGFTTTVADDGGHMLIGLSPASTTHSAGCPILAVMVDKNMEPLWANKLTTDPGNVRTDVVATKVDANGSAWYLIKNVTDAAPKAKEVVGYSYTLYRLDSLGQQAYPLEMTKREHVQDASMALLPNGAIVVAGVYSSTDAARNESIGIFRTLLDRNEGQWSAVARTPFNKQTVDKVERLQTNIRLGQLWPKSNGGLFVVAERAGIETHLVSNLSGQKVEKTEWVNGAFHVMALDGGGEAAWYTEVPREMSYANNGPGKAFSIAYSDVLFLFFNDDARNIDLRKKKQPVNGVDKPRDALMLEFKDDGNYKEKPVLQAGVKAGYFDADDLWFMGDGLVGLEGAPDFRKDRTFPVLIDLATGDRR
ncbi:MAG TPA: hypothetical protein PKD45_11070 [Flavobacteriales bacterium]|nr:hypothetical protein [Flavobacteriales bacterium]